MTRPTPDEIEEIREAARELRIDRSRAGDGSMTDAAVVALLAEIDALRGELATADFYAWWRRHESWSWNTFGPSDIRGPEGPIDHLRKEVEELARAPRDIEEVADVIHLAVDVAWRAGYTFREFMEALNAKQAKNKGRKWPDWRTVPVGQAIEHDRSEEG